MTSVATPSRPEAQAPPRAAPPDWLRGAVRSVLLGTPAYQELDPAQRRDLAQAMVKVGQLAAECIAEERAAQAQIDARPVARALQDPGFGESASRMAQVTRDTLEAISFPRFVTDLLNGVFRAMNDSSQARTCTSLVCVCSKPPAVLDTALSSCRYCCSCAWLESSMACSAP